MKVHDENAALELAVKAGADSPCAKSKRGVVVFCRHYGLLGVGNNHPPEPFRCNGSEECHAHCNKVCVHAEMDAVAGFFRDIQMRRDFYLQMEEELGGVRPEMLHVKVVNGEAVPSGEPSCWQCSRHVINFGIEAFWLLHEDGLRRYSVEEFHEHTLHTCRLPVVR